MILVRFTFTRCHVNEVSMSFSIRFTFTRCHVNEVSMSFSIRPYRRFPLCCPVTYHAGLHEGHGTVWNLSLTGWRLSGDLPLRIGQSFPMRVTRNVSSSQPELFDGRWVRSMGLKPSWPMIQLLTR